jgi:hypothetical protein
MQIGRDQPTYAHRELRSAVLSFRKASKGGASWSALRLSCPKPDRLLVPPQKSKSETLWDCARCVPNHFEDQRLGPA